MNLLGRISLASAIATSTLFCGYEWKNATYWRDKSYEVYEREDYWNYHSNQRLTFNFFGSGAEELWKCMGHISLFSLSASVALNSAGHLYIDLFKNKKR